LFVNEKLVYVEATLEADTVVPVVVPIVISPTEPVLVPEGTMRTSTLLALVSVLGFKLNPFTVMKFAVGFVAATILPEVHHQNI
jgi:hypothetical protein